jgi:hypothetical protein
MNVVAESSFEVVSKDSFAILYFLLPGLITAAIFYSLTAHPKKETFERVVQALIFTVIIKAMNICVRKVWFHCWEPTHKGFWNDDKELVWSVVNAVILGIGFSAMMNWDLAHCVLRKLKITKRTSYPSEWYSAFHKYKRDVVLYLNDKRRLRGWAMEYPDQADKGHFLIQNIRWLDDDGNEYPQTEVEATIIAAADVYMVQFLPDDLKRETGKDEAEIEKDRKKLIEFRKKKEAEIEKNKKESENARGVQRDKDDKGK